MLYTQITALPQCIIEADIDRRHTREWLQYFYIDVVFAVDSQGKIILRGFAYLNCILLDITFHEISTLIAKGPFNWRVLIKSPTGLGMS